MGNTEKSDNYAESFDEKIRKIAASVSSTDQLVLECQKAFDQFAPDKELRPLFREIEGSKLLLVAPHATAHFRRGRLGDRKEDSDKNTAGIALALAHKLGCSYLISTGLDEEWRKSWKASSDAFKSKLESLAENTEYCVIDLHGFGNNSPTGQIRNWGFDLDIGTGDGTGDSKYESVAYLADVFLSALLSQGIETRINEKFGATSDYTITAFLQPKRPPVCLQLEMSARFREPTAGSITGLERALRILQNVAPEYLPEQEPEDKANSSSSHHPFKGLIDFDHLEKLEALKVRLPRKFGSEDFHWVAAKNPETLYLRKVYVREAQIRRTMNPEEAAVSRELFEAFKDQVSQLDTCRFPRARARWRQVREPHVFAVAVNVDKSSTRSTSDFRHYPTAVFRLIPDEETDSKKKLRPREIRFHSVARQLLDLDSPNPNVYLVPVTWSPNRVLTKHGENDERPRRQFKLLQVCQLIGTIARRGIRMFAIALAGSPQVRLTVVPSSESLGFGLDQRRDVAVSKWTLQNLGAKPNQQLIIEWLGKRHRVTAFEFPEDHDAADNFPTIEVPASIRASLQAPVGAAITVSRSMNSLVRARVFLTGAFAIAMFFGSQSILSAGGDGSTVNWWAVLWATLIALGGSLVALVLGLTQERLPKSSALPENRNLLDAWNRRDHKSHPIVASGRSRQSSSTKDVDVEP